MLINNSIYRVLPVQIIQFWDAIKYACIQADELKAEQYLKYFNELLQALLSDTAQCFIVLNNDRVLHAIAVTRITINKVQLQKELDIQCLYSMSAMSDSELRKYFKFIANFATQEECKVITFSSRNSRIWQVANTVGCTERHRTFIFELGGNYNG